MQARGEFLRNIARDLALGENIQVAEHVTVLKVAVIALDGLVYDRPHLLGAAALGSTPRAEHLECREPERRRELVEKGGLSSLVRCTDLFRVLGHEHGERVEDLPARLRLGAIERVDHLGDVRDEQLGLMLGEQRGNARGELARAPARASQIVDKRCERRVVLLDARQRGELLRIESLRGDICHSNLPLLTCALARSMP